MLGGTGVHGYQPNKIQFRKGRLQTSRPARILQEPGFQRLLTSAEVETAVSRFDSTELAFAPRQGWFVIDRHNGVPLCAVADRQAENACSKAGFKATARVNRQVLIDTISSTYADSIADKASNALSQMCPGLSANRVVTPAQTVFGCMLLATGGVVAWYFPDAFRLMLVVMFSTLFVAVGCLKLASVFVHGKAIPPDLACLQARLSFYNSNENWLTRQFTMEYASVFDLMLPMLARFGLPLPLGGTSNHFRLDALRQAGGWDAWNVTEDTDLGLRLSRMGYRSEVLVSSTFEEANCEVRNWLFQRARWLKGWMQTWLVHMRNPVRTWRELGTASFLVSQLLMAGMIGSALLHPVFAVILVHDLAWSKHSPDPLYQYCALAVLVFGYAAVMLAAARALYMRRLYPLFPSILTMPVYWMLISIGGWLALWQLIRALFH